MCDTNKPRIIKQLSSHRAGYTTNTELRHYFWRKYFRRPQTPLKKVYSLYNVYNAAVLFFIIIPLHDLAVVLRRSHCSQSPECRYGVSALPCNSALPPPPLSPRLHACYFPTSPLCDDILFSRPDTLMPMTPRGARSFSSLLAPLSRAARAFRPRECITCYAVIQLGASTCTSPC